MLKWSATQPKTITGHCGDGMGGLPAGLPVNAVGGHMSCLRAARERVEYPSHVAHFLGIEHLMENREDAPLFLSHSHGSPSQTALICSVAPAGGAGQMDPRSPAAASCARGLRPRGKRGPRLWRVPPYGVMARAAR